MRSVPVSSQLAGTDDGAWRRPACGDSCSRVRVLVADGAFRGWRDVVSHDHAAYERGLERTLRLLVGAVLGHVCPLGPPLEIDSLSLSMDEYRLLVLLAEHPGEVVGRRELAVAMWPGSGSDRALTLGDQARLRALVCRLRDRLGEAAACVETVPGVGLRFRQDRVGGLSWPG